MIIKAININKLIIDLNKTKSKKYNLIKEDVLIEDEEEGKVIHDFQVFILGNEFISETYYRYSNNFESIIIDNNDNIEIEPYEDNKLPSKNEEILAFISLEKIVTINNISYTLFENLKHLDDFVGGLEKYVEEFNIDAEKKICMNLKESELLNIVDSINDPILKEKFKKHLDFTPSIHNLYYIAKK